jgi:HK97 family phage portal protein
VKFPARIKSALSALRGMPLDGYPFAAVAASPWQFWQRGLDRTHAHNPQVAAVGCAIDSITQAVSQLPCRYYRSKADGGKEIIAGSAANRTLRRPNHYQQYSEFWSMMIRELYTTGNAYAVATRNDRFEINSLHPLYSQQVDVTIETESRGIFYRLKASNTTPFTEDVAVPARDVLHLKLHTPMHPLCGVTPLEYAAYSIAANSALGSHMATFFQNMARPSFVLSTEASLTAVQMKQLRDAWEEQSVRLSSGHTPILANGLKAQTLSLSSQDAQVVQAFNLTVEDIARAMRIPLPMMGINTTYNNTEQLISFWLATGLGFLINHIEASLDVLFEAGPNEFTEFDTDVLLRTDFAARVDSCTKGIMGGLFSPNEARARMELPSVKFGDEPRVQQQVVPLSQIGKMPEPAPAPPAPPPAPAGQPDDAKSIDTDIIKALVRSRLTERMVA